MNFLIVYQNNHEEMNSISPRLPSDPLAIVFTNVNCVYVRFCSNKPIIEDMFFVLNSSLQFHEHHSYFIKKFQMLFAVNKGKI